MFTRFDKESLKVNGVDVVMLTAGRGTPLLFLHGAGTWTGFDFALPWSEHHRVMIPFHPGWGESGDAPGLISAHDYVMHYLELIDQLGLDQVDLAGFSMGGRLAATFASEQRTRVRKLALIAPAGLNVPEHALTDFTKVAPQDVPKYLIENQSVLLPHLVPSAEPAWQAARAREGESFLRVLQTGLTVAADSNLGFSRWLHRLTMPSLLVWGEKDRTTPVEQADAWVKAVPSLELHRIPNAGHLVLDENRAAARLVGDFLAA